MHKKGTEFFNLATPWNIKESMCTCNMFQMIKKKTLNSIHKNSTNEPRHDKINKMTVRPAKTQISLGIRPVWLVFAVRMKNLGPLTTHWAQKTDQTGRMPRLIWVFAGRTLIFLVLSCRDSNTIFLQRSVLHHDKMTKITIIIRRLGNIYAL